MGRKKRKTSLKKIRRRAVWPTFVGFIVVCIVFTVLYSVIIGYFLQNIVDQKSQTGYEMAMTVKTFLDEFHDLNDSELLLEEIRQLERVNRGIKGVCLLDEDNGVIWQTDNDRPDFENNLSYQQKGFAILIDQALEDMFFKAGDSNASPRKLSEDNGFVFHRQLFSRVLESGSNIFMNPRERIVLIPCWIVLDREEGADYQLCVKAELYMQSSEIAPFLIAMMLSAFFSLIMLIWFIISFFHLIVDRRRLDRILSFDPVTGGMNWSYFVKNGTKVLSKNRNKHNHYAVISIALRKYTNYCTCYGVHSGEELLSKFYSILQDCIGKKEIAVRYERAEFALLILFDDETALEIRLKKIAFLLNSATADQNLHFSTGIYIIDKNENNITEIYNSAVIARNCCSDETAKQVCYFTSEMYNEQVWERKVENDMEKALYNHEFEVYLQPKYDTMKEILCAAEALVRWNHPSEGFVPPGKFIPIFESNGFILQLDDYMLTEVCRLQASWIARGEAVVPISVNVSRAHFSKSDLAEHICKIVDFFKVPHSVIELELTESAFFDDKMALLSIVKKLRGSGFKVSMDDFGAGYSSLNTLKELPLDIVKLDAEFFRGKDEMNRGKLIVEETITLAKKLNMKIVAEGIETREQVDFLKQNGCDLIQGYYFAKPLPVREFEKRAFKKTAETTTTTA
ncbi:MAG: GGDEF domain-containing phosphodiesterase [Treponemataceae bacterium]|nr:GGDEF domain-containing phosphodiesterase [Treponemataceae bacterium]